MSTSARSAERRRRILSRALPILVVAVVAFGAGLLIGSAPDAPAAIRFLDAWESGDTASMHEELTEDARERVPLEEFEALYEDAAATATTSSLEVGEPSQEGDEVTAPITVETRVFGTLGGDLQLPMSEGLVAWEPHLVFPELEPGERLARRTRAPRRAAILAADRSPLAEGPVTGRTVAGNGASSIVGELGSPSRGQAREVVAAGFPPGTLVGTSGLELAFQSRLAGTPGGQLLAVSADEEATLAGGRVLATSQPEPAKPVRTTIDPELQGITVAALGSQLGGIAVLDARNGAVLALAGIAYSATQPPGSTFKIITTTGALEAEIVQLSDTFPVESSNSDIGREISNSNDAPCGGTFAESFANSCNTVFAPLGAELGGERLVEAAESYGWNSPPTLFDAEATEAVDPPNSTIPTEINSTVEAGETAIGQGRVLATPLQMASVAQTIANGGMRSPTAITRDPEVAPEAEEVRVTSPEIATTIRDLMVGVVEDGTGTAAAVPGVQVAGKTGTAELGPAALEPGQELAPGEDPPQEKTAWFAAFAPAEKPSLAVAVMLPNSDDDGGVVAAPIASDVLAQGLGAG